MLIGQVWAIVVSCPLLTWLTAEGCKVEVDFRLVIWGLFFGTIIDALAGLDFDFEDFCSVALSAFMIIVEISYMIVII